MPYLSQSRHPKRVFLVEFGGLRNYGHLMWSEIFEIKIGFCSICSQKTVKPNIDNFYKK